MATAPTPAFVLAGTHSGCGKTTLAAGLLRAFRNQGLAVAPFKCGPDYLDPQLHRVAAGRESWNLDGWFLEDGPLRDAFRQGAAGAPGAGCAGLGLVEGVMGLFDGADPVSFQGSTADLARRLGLPVVLVVDGSGLGGSVAATVLGHQTLWPDLELAGVILNRLGGERHFRLQAAAIRAHTRVPVLGWMPASRTWRLPERHLGIYRPHELPDLEAALDTLAAELAATVDLDALRALARVPGAGAGVAADKQASGAGVAADKQASGDAGVATDQQAVCEAGDQADDTLVRSLAAVDVPVALARDEAFCFIYADTLARLERLGVRWVPFSPLREGVPEGVAGIYLPGGYPELHARELAANGAFLEGLRRAGRRDLPLFAECGGYMVLAEALVDAEGRSHAMAGLIPGRARMTGRLQAFGYKRLRALGDNLLCRAGAEGRAHEFHHSVWEGGPAAPAWRTENLRGEAAEEGFARGNLLASYGHLHFGAQPGWAESWVMRLRYHGSLRKEEP